MGLSPFPHPSSSSRPTSLLYYSSALPPRAPPSMPLPPIPGPRRPSRLPGGPASTSPEPTRDVSGSMLPTTISTTTTTTTTTTIPSPSEAPQRLPRKSSYQTLRSPAMRAASNLPMRTRAVTPTIDENSQPKDTPSPAGSTSASRPSTGHTRTVSIGSFPQPPKGTGPRSPLSPASSPDVTPSLLFARTPRLRSRASSPLLVTKNEDRAKADTQTPARTPKTRLRPTMIPTSGLPTPPHSATAALPQTDKLHDGTTQARPSSSDQDSATTEHTHFEGFDSKTVVPPAYTPKPKRTSDVAASLPGLRSTKSSTNLDDGRGNVVVSVRVRPNGHGTETPARDDWVVDSRRSAITYKGGEGGDFRYDNVFNTSDDNEKVYDSSAKRLVRRVMEGYNGTVFAYGITGTGKTFSMQGTAQSPGMIPLAITDIFSYIREHPDREFLLRVSYLEIYNEKIYDLLSGSQQDNITLREDSKRGVYATPLKEEIVQSPTQLLRVIARGDVARRTSSTQFNARSSRSHAVVQIVIESRARAAQVTSEDLPAGVLISTLSLIDLAGSERAADDKARRAEGSHINKSLLTLGNVISRLSAAKGDKKHLPYRDSKLTRLLQSALSGDALISILCTVHLSSAPGATSSLPSETLNTLSFASRAKNNIVSHAKRNESLPATGSDAYALLDRYRAEIEDLKRQVEAQSQKTPDPQRTEEEEERWLEREREAAERHEEQMLEMQLARTALKERISHLNKLILSSKSVGVNVSAKNSPQLGDSPPEAGAALSPRISTASVPVMGNERLAAIGLGLRGYGTQSALDHNPLTMIEDDAEEDSCSGTSGEASARQQVVALQADLADKNRYIATLERRLLEARRLTGSRSRPSDGSGSGIVVNTIEETNKEDVIAEKDREISDLRSKLDDQIKMVQALRNAARRRGMLDLRSVSTSSVTTIAEAITADTEEKKMKTHASRPSLSSPTTRSINFSRLVPSLTPQSDEPLTPRSEEAMAPLKPEDTGLVVGAGFAIELPASPVMVGGMF